MKAEILLVSSYKELPECWVHYNGVYVYYSPNTSRQINLPQVHIEYEPVLKKLGVGYRRSFCISNCNQTLEFWDKNKHEEEDLELPLFEYLPCKQAYLKIRECTHKHPTAKAISAAWELMQAVYDSTYEYDFVLKEKRVEEAVRRVLDGKVAVAVRLDELGQELEDEILACGTENFISENYRFKIVPVMTLHPKYAKSQYYAIFDVNNIELNSRIKLYVESNIKEMVIGKDAWQVKEWGKQFGLKSIDVVETE